MKFSIIIPTYNRSDLLVETINSALNQTFKDYEIIVVNDGSTDNTKDVLNEFGDRIKVLHKENSGAEKSRNAGAEIASGDYFCFLDSDDLMFPWTLEVCKKVIEINNPAILICSVFNFHGKNLSFSTTDFPKYCEYIVFNNYLEKTLSVFTSSSAMVIKKDIFISVKGFRQDYTIKKYYLDDDFFIQKVATFGPFVYIKYPNLVAYRFHKENSRNNIERILISLKEIVRAINSNEFGDSSFKFRRLSIVGGLAAFWVKKAIKNKMYFQVLLLLPSVSFAILLAIYRKTLNKFSKKFSFQQITLT